MSLLTQASLVLTPTSYKANKLYSVVPSSGSGDMTTTRATSASRTNSSGLIENVLTGVPRLDYSGSTPSILLEPQRTNLAAYSTQFNDAYWPKQNCTISSNLVTAPDGTTTADKIISSLVTGRIAIPKTFTVTANAKNTFTLYAKAAEWSRICVFHDSPSFSESAYYASNIFIDLLTGTSTSPSIAKATSVGNGWYRIETSATPTTTGHPISIVPLDPSTTNVNSVVGDGVSGVYIWGAQFESSASYATSYIPTTTSTVTRNAELMTLNNIYTNNFITSAGGTWFMEFVNNFALLRDGAGSFAIQTSQISDDNGLIIKVFNIGATTSRLQVNKRLNDAESTLYTTLTDRVKIAVDWNGTTADVFVNGVKVVTTTSFAITNMNYFNASITDVPRYITQMALFPTTLTDAECISLTTL